MNNIDFEIQEILIKKKIKIQETQISSTLVQENPDNIDYIERQIRNLIIYFVQNKVFFPKILAHIIIKDKQPIFQSQTTLLLELMKTFKQLSSNSEIMISKRMNEIGEKELIYLMVSQIEEQLNRKIQINLQNLTSVELKTISRLFKDAHQYNVNSELEQISLKFSLFIQNIKLISNHFSKIFDWKKLNIEEIYKNDQQINSDKNQSLINAIQNQKLQRNLCHEKYQNIQKYNSFSNKNERMDDFTIRFLMLKLVEHTIVYPKLLKFIKFTYSRKDLNSFNAEGIITIDPDIETLRQICTLPQIEKLARDLSLPLFTQYVPKNIKEVAMQKYPQYYMKNYFDSLHEYVVQIKTNLNDHLEILKEIYEDEKFIAFLQQIWNLGGKEIQDKLKNHSVRKASNEGTNLISLGCILFEIKLIIENKSEINFDQTSIKNIRDVCQSQRMHSPLLKLFFFNLTNQDIGYPQLLMLLHFTNNTLIQVDRKVFLEQLVQHSFFIQFIKRNFSYDIELHEPSERIELIFFTNKFIVDSEVSETWPKIILKQLMIIYQNREQYQQQLREVINSQTYQKYYLEINTDQQSNSLKQQIKEVLRKINEYILMN